MYLHANNIYQMAIIFTTDISEDKLLMAYNNNVVRFSSDSDMTPLHCDIVGLGMNVKIYPTPDNSFYFNLKDYVSSYVNTNRFQDTVTSELSDTPESFTYDASNGSFKSGAVLFQINFIDETNETVVKNLMFLAGAIQLEDFKRFENPMDQNYIILSPTRNQTSNDCFLKYWEGFPFEFSFFTKFPNDAFVLKNNTNGLEQQFPAKSNVTAMFISDGRTDISVEDFVALVDGYNNLNFFHNGENQNLNVFLEKLDSDCGIYVKWMNSKGRFNYWLLSENKRDRTSKYNPELENDFDNLDSTMSPIIQTGKESSDLLRGYVKKLSDWEKEVFIGIFDSPKVYYFTGERFSRSTHLDWIEVSVKNTSANVSDKNKRLYSYTIDLQLPQRYTQKL